MKKNQENICKTMQQIEDTNVEYKQEINDKVARTILAFLNTNGGIIYLGVDDETRCIIQPIDDKTKQMWIDKLSMWKSQLSNDGYDLINWDSSTIPIKITVREGKQKPYSLSNSSPEFFVRIGSTTQRASLEQIGRMFLNSEPYYFEKKSIERTDLTFNYFKKALEKLNIKFNPKKLSLINDDNKYNNIALYFSDQCQIVTKLAYYQGLTKEIFLDKADLSGSILEQIDTILKTTEIYNKTKATFPNQTYRLEVRDYPTQALREAILNAFCHRDYSLINSDITISFFDDRVEVYSPGGLVENLTLEQIKNGVNNRRNKGIAQILRLLQFVEEQGRGVELIFDSYKNFDKQPRYDVNANMVKVTLYNRNYESTNINRNGLKHNVRDKVIERQKIILDLIKQNPNITISEISQQLKISRATLNLDLQQLQKSEKLFREGSKKTGEWKIKTNK
ncbi:ATP-binding protein [Mesomycoplasma hyorhinis]|uniref:DeoR family transcriptional regulator n=4 Tax=Mesomycoplasma hyorhinis TaxID=2100 RepID=A0AAJ3D751_MESHY|nr:ATP-binding protein [Mesomycoplasma hyorhinis]MXR07523.1 DeoR family transcriptional regulator [Mesomycoplasma hyorhinis]MXR08268.1 DeoR family transcriptional regulator [Mesomycoplasma hyorhinis]MXR08640.1 DeoR family transcriptional regulator [Mesomycoplasma hyorhinis]MXR09740.1 DeoR family transcriptional regulator [Mesomycoplasma hyorhinis]MXR11814.1 DeoR family transcriptional regulator [Mesomycoplasma hyorhinis]